jgi:molecular chaperone DnaJ
MSTNSWTRNGKYHDLFDVFREVFGGGGFGDFFGFGRGNSKRSGEQAETNLPYDLKITLKEAFYGIEKTIKYNKNVTCSKCNGSGTAPESKSYM